MSDRHRFRALLVLLLLGGTGRLGVSAEIELPAGKILELRLTQSLASFSTKKGSPVEAVVIAPVGTQSQVVIPAGSKLSGTVKSVNRVGLGLLREAAHLTLEFDRLSLPDGSVVSLDVGVREIDNAREVTDAKGRIKGIRSTGTIGFRANNLLAGAAMVDPIAYIYVTIASARMLRFSEPEIWFPAGTELSAKLNSPLRLAKTFPPDWQAIAAPPEQRKELRSLIRALPFRTVTQNANKPSDLTNLAFLGSPVALKRAFVAAGWVEADRLNVISGFLTLRSIAEVQRYQSAPMSTLLLDEQRPRYTFSKSLDTFSKRHHVRIWVRPDTWRGQPLLTASSTQDIGIQLSRKQRNATGEALKTDGRIAVLQMNECEHPRDPVDLQKTPDIPTTGPLVERGFRQGILITKNDLYRGNLIYQGIEGTKMGVHYFKHKDDAAQKGRFLRRRPISSHWIRMKMSLLVLSRARERVLRLP